MSLEVKGYHDNTGLITSIDGDKWASVQNGTALTNMKRISVDNLFSGREGIKLNTAPALTHFTATDAGVLTWDEDDNTLLLGLGTSTMSVGRGIETLGKNAEATSLNVGEIVYLYSADSDVPTVKRASASAHATARVLYMVKETIAASATGTLVCYGPVGGFDTSGWTVGTLVYLDTSSGALTATAPVAPNQKVIIGFVLKQNASTGIVHVMVNAYGNLSLLSDVDSTDLDTTGEVLSWNETSGKFEVVHNLVTMQGEIDTLNDSDDVSGSVLNAVKELAEDATYDNTDSGLTAVTIKTAIDENAGDIDDLETAEAAIKGTGWTDENLVNHEDRIATAETDITNAETFALTQKNVNDQRYNTLLSKYNQSAGETYGADDIYQYASTGEIGDGYEDDGTPLDVSAVVVDGDFQSMAVQGMTITNEAPATLATSLDGWTSVYDSIVSSKYRLTHTSDATGERSIATLLDVTKYYLIACIGKSASDTAGAKFDILAGTGGAVKATSTTLTATQTARIGAILQPSDLTGTTPHLLMTHKGSGYAEFYEFFISEITATEYALGLAQMLERFPFVDGTESVGEQGVRIVGVNFADLQNGVIEGFVDTGAKIFGYVAGTQSIVFKVKAGEIYYWNRATGGDRNVMGYFANYPTSGEPTLSYLDSRLNLLIAPAGAEWGVFYVANVGTAFPTDVRISVGSQIGNIPYNSQTRFLPAIGNRLPNATLDEVREADIQVAGQTVRGWEKVQRVSTPQAVASGVAVNTTNYPTALNAGQWYNILDAGGSETGVVGTDSTTGAGTLYFALATPITTTYPDIPTLSAKEGGTIQRFPGTEEVQAYSSGLTFSYDVLTVLHCYKLSSGVVTDVTDDCTISTDTVTVSGASDGEIYLIGVEFDKYDAMGALVHAPPVSNMASKMALLAGGTTGQVLTKTSDDDYDFAWA